MAITAQKQAPRRPQGPPEINFTKGINTFQVNRLLLDPGEDGPARHALADPDGDRLDAAGNLGRDARLV